LQLGAARVTTVETCGSLHLAHRSDELAVLEEFRDLGEYEVSLLTPQEVSRRSQLSQLQNLQGGLWSSTELRVDPRTASSRLANWLQEVFGLTCHFRSLIHAIEGEELVAADGRRWSASKIIIASGSDLQTLYPEIFAQSGLRLCKLQMLRSIRQPLQFENEPHLASGLTLRHYQAFQKCPALAALRTRIATETPELDRYGIHVMASAFPGGEVILGDSHEYDAEITPFDKAEIDTLLLRELQKVFHLPDWSISERWHGVYAKHPQLPIFTAAPAPHVEICVGPGGAGMTMSFGLAEKLWQQWS
jgi:FAD dependent oxidoreductase TIGR03364